MKTEFANNILMDGDPENTVEEKQKRRSRMSVESFTINIAQSTLDDVRERLARTRWPDEVEAAGWDYGTNLDYLNSLVLR